MNSTGSRIKSITKSLSTIIIVLSLITLCYGLFLFIEDHDYIEYATIFGGAYSYSSLEEAGNNALKGLIAIISSVSIMIPTILISFVMYGFGEMIENTARLVCIAERIEKHTDDGVSNEKKLDFDGLSRQLKKVIDATEQNK